jgi:hypothetical protein
MGMLSHSFWEKTWSDPAIFWAMATFMVTLALVVVAWIELGDLARTSRADFIFRLKNDFFTDAARGLLLLVEENLLQFEDAAVPYFTVRGTDDPDLSDRFKELKLTGPTVSTYFVDDVLLGPFEDIDLFLAEKLITVKHAHGMFYTYVAMCKENGEIQKYVQAIRREPGNSGIYSGFDDLYRRLRAFQTRWELSRGSGG